MYTTCRIAIIAHLCTIPVLASRIHSGDKTPALPHVTNGWNTSIGGAKDRDAAAQFFHTNVTDDESLWFDNVMTPFIGKQLKMVAIDIEERNAFNTLIEVAVTTGTVLWTVNEGPPGVCGDWVEEINGMYSGVARTAGFASRTSWIENDSKSLFGHSIANDWGLMDVVASNRSTVVIRYWSYQKAKFTMTWQIQ
jgi:hypothetical protein